MQYNMDMILRTNNFQTHKLSVRDTSDTISRPELEVQQMQEMEIASTIDLLEKIKQNRDTLFKNKLLNGFKDHEELRKFVKQ